MKRVLIIIFLLSSALCASAQTDIESLLKLLDHKRVEFSFSCRLKGDIPLDLSGTVVAQGDSFIMKANGVETYCDGQKVVMLDKEKKEAYIESASGLKEYLIGNFNALSDLKISSSRIFDNASEDTDEFDYNTAALDPSWVVTDLRQ